MKFVHWYDRALPTEEDALDELLRGFADDDGEGDESAAAPSPVSDEAARARAGRIAPQRIWRHGAPRRCRTAITSSCSPASTAG